MGIVKIEAGKVVQKWANIRPQPERIETDPDGNKTVIPAKSALEVFADEYGVSGPEYVEADQTPGMLFDGVNFTAPVPVVAPITDADRVLSPPQFAFLLALTGFDEVWSALETNIKTTDRAQFASLRAERARTRFRLDRTLAIVALFRTAAAAIAPGIDLSEAAIRAAWAQAEAFTGANTGAIV